jgi:hypothetical protein
MLPETLKWIVTGLPFILRDWKLISRILSGKVAG